jgi:hypothetical protein
VNNNIRFDLSNYLIHFFRDIDLLGRNGILFPEHMGWQNLYEDTFLPANFMLRAALRNGRLWATWSIRNGVRTVYGPSPAICFTEMPIAAFLQAGDTRWKSGQAMSPFALVFPKEALYRLGALPVISGAASEIHFSASYDAAGNRMLPESIFPSAEQFRYVTFDIGGTRNIDWTHEREWRWPCRLDFSVVNQKIQDFGTVSCWDEIPGLDFYSLGISGIGVIVETKRQLDLVVSDMLTLVDSGQANVETFGFVLASKLLPAPSQLQDPANIAQAIASAMVNLDPYFSQPQTVCEMISNRFGELVRQVEDSAGLPSDGEFGSCWLWLHDNAAPLTRALLRTERAFVTRDGRYLASLYEFSDSRGLRERESMTSRLASMVRAEFGTSCGYFSVWCSDDPTTVPFYADDFDEDIGFFNCSWNV